MAITYPLALPTVTGRRRMRIIAHDVVGEAESPFTKEQQVYQWPGQILRAEVTLPPMKRASAEEWVAWLLSLKGAYGTFLMGDPIGATARGVATGSPLVNGAHSVGASSLATKGWSISVTNILRAGDWLQLGTGATTRLHKNLKDVNSDGSGNATLDIWPNLRAAAANNDPIAVSSTQGLWRLDSNDRSWDVDEASLYGIVFQAKEAF